VKPPFHPNEKGIREAGYLEEIEGTEAGGAYRTEIVGSCPENDKTHN
jgi:hypothetical protein